MSEYKRFTERDEFGNTDIIGVESEVLLGDLPFEQLNRATNALNKFAELEDKLEDGRLVELPCIKEVGYGKGKIYRIYFINTDRYFKGVIDYYVTPNEDRAKTILKYLKEANNAD